MARGSIIWPTFIYWNFLSGWDWNKGKYRLKVKKNTNQSRNAIFILSRFPKFIIQGPNASTKKMLHRINESGKLYMVPAIMGEIYVIRFTIITENANDGDITYAWKIISKIADKLPPTSGSHFERHDIVVNGRLDDIDEPGLITYMYPMMKTHRRLSIPCDLGDSSDEETNKVAFMAARRKQMGRRLSTPQVYIPCKNTHQYPE